MDEVWWGLIRSWHAFRVTRAIEVRTYCGRVLPPGARTDQSMPTGKTCESCLRAVARGRGL